MPQPFTSFVILAGMRTGSNFLEANLNALPGVVSHGEVFNPHFIGKQNVTELFGITLEAREANPRPLLRKLRTESPGLSGFRFFHDHDPRVLDILLADPACAKIILTRNPVDSYVSWQIARATGQWKLTDAKRLKTATARFDEGEFRDHLSAEQSFQRQILHGLQTSGQTAFVLDYEDLASVEVLNGLAAFLGVEGRLKAVDDTLKKQNPEALEDKLENPQDLAAAVARADLFALARSPVFEPRRPAAIPHVTAARDAPLLFFPVRSGPEGAVRDWLSSLGGLVEGFDNRTLRQWKRDHPGHRAFTVVRHPLLRAHVAFREKIVSGQLADQRRSLIRAWKANLPDPGRPFPDPAAEREAFLVFLNWCRLATSGQTGNRVDPNWASQSAILQGFAGFHPLDLVIREDCLPRSLAFLAAEIGVTAPPPPAADPAAQALATIWDESLETAAEAAYARDYTGFGFTRWRM
ncbi:sulfotransferase domain-containing protein [Tabrizicola soli]|uniref:Sulfotransferase domain-containing protein n=1 Tax=Tabrizicola soli TaxID=2185115 RepID=A0ABV7E3L1_9RHOB|nr:sulfotransferase domain-containing protein [Tabrizicola soli]